MSLACKDCGSIAEPDAKLKGSLGVEVILWLCFIVPGLVYSLWRRSTQHDVCASCGSAKLVPLDTPVGREIATKNPGQVPRIERARPPRQGAIAFGRALGRMFAKR